MHATVIKNGEASKVFITPVITRGEGKNVAIANTANGGGTFAKLLAYVFEASKDKSYGNKTLIEACKTLHDSVVKTGKSSDVFCYLLPIRIEDRDNVSDLTKWTVRFTSTREELIKTIKTVLTIDEAFNKSDTGEVKTVNEMPVYTDNSMEAGKRGRGKKSGGILEF